jgi:hypothetical protein
VDGSLAHQAQGVYDKLPDEKAKAAMRNVVLRMVSLEGSQPARRRVRLSELKSAEPEETARASAVTEAHTGAPLGELTYADPEETTRARAALDALTNARLVVCDEKDGVLFAEPAHDKIVLGWPLLQTWLDDPEERKRIEAVSVLRELHRNKAGVLDRDPRLNTWLSMLEDAKSNPFNKEESELLRQSVKARSDALAQAEKRVRELEAALRRARDHARMSAAREANGDPTTQVALLREVEKPEATRGWMQLACALLREPVASVVWKGHEGAVWSASWSPDGKRIVTGSDDKTARIWLVTIPDLRQALLAATSYCLTPEQRRTYLGETEPDARTQARPAGEIG